MPGDREEEWVAVPFRVRREQFDRIESARGLVARERFLRALVDEGLDRRIPPQLKTGAAP